MEYIASFKMFVQITTDSTLTDHDSYEDYQLELPTDTVIA